MSPAQRQGWLTLLDLARAFPDGWCLVGGQMVWLLAAEHGARPPRATDDVDIVADIRAGPARIPELCRWLEDNGLGLQGISPEGIGHRYARAASPGARRHHGRRARHRQHRPAANLSTTRGARTVQATGSRRALDDSGHVKVAIAGTTGRVRRPALTAAIILKATATTIPTRMHAGPDLSDAAFLLSLVPDPIAAARTLTKSDQAKLRAISALQDDQHPAWRPLSAERARLGQTALDIMLDPRPRLPEP